MKNLISHLKQYQPKLEQERVDQQTIITFLSHNADALERTNTIAHVTTSTIVVNPAMDRVVFGFHNIYQSWGWIGGHNDGDEDCHHVALKETMEETGLTRLTFYSKEIFMLDVIYVPSHLKNGKHVSDHLHLNITYLLIADEQERLVHAEEEHQGMQWFAIKDVLKLVKEPRMIPIYQKAFAKIMLIKEHRS